MAAKYLTMVGQLQWLVTEFQPKRALSNSNPNG